MAIGTQIKLAFKGAEVQRGLAKIKAAFAKLNKAGGKMFGSLIKNAAKFTAILGPAAAGIGIAKIGTDALRAASGIESLTSQFKTLLGSQDAAVKRMSLLQEFAATTPYETAELAATSKMLQNLGGELLSTGEGLRIVGDAAAMAGQPLEEVGLHVGRLFGALTSGTSAGESIARLQELGLISGAAKRQFEALAKAQASGKSKILGSADALNVLQQVLKKSAGSMANLSSTTEGRFSNLKDTYMSLLVALGTPINAALRPMIGELEAKLSQLKASASRGGSAIGAGLTALRNAFKNGDLWNLVKTGFLAASSVIAEKLVAAFVYGGTVLTNAIKNGIRGTDLGMLGKVKVGENVPMRWADASEIARNAFNSEGHVNAFRQVVDRNQTALPPGFQRAPADAATPYRDEYGAKLLKVMERVEMHLAPQ